MSNKSKPKRPRARPTIYGEKMVQTAFYVRQDQLDWIKQHGGGKKLRELIDKAMDDEPRV